MVEFLNDHHPGPSVEEVSKKIVSLVQASVDEIISPTGLLRNFVAVIKVKNSYILVQTTDNETDETFKIRGRMLSEKPLFFIANLIEAVGNSQCRDLFLVDEPSFELFLHLADYVFWEDRNSALIGDEKGNIVQIFNPLEN